LEGRDGEETIGITVKRFFEISRVARLWQKS